VEVLLGLLLVLPAPLRVIRLFLLQGPEMLLMRFMLRMRMLNMLPMNMLPMNMLPMFMFMAFMMNKVKLRVRRTSGNRRWPRRHRRRVRSHWLLVSWEGMSVEMVGRRMMMLM